MNRPDLRDLINKHKSIERLNNNDTDNNNNNKSNNNNNNNNNYYYYYYYTDRREWKIMLRMHIKCISTKNFIENF